MVRRRAAFVTQVCLLGAVIVVAGTAGIGCDDPMLPSDYAGPPASAVRGTVAGSSRDASRPHLALAWLARGANGATTPLVGQSLSFQRSAALHSDWDIGLGFPADAAKLDTTIGDRPVRLAVAKMVYFDDRVADARLDWSCRGDGCDVVKAVSTQFVVYVDAPPTCTTRTGIRPRVAAGYHYYSYVGGRVRELGAAESMTFTLLDRSVADSNPAAALSAFLDSLLWSWTLTAVDGC